jgi:hypothetical protein
LFFFTPFRQVLGPRQFFIRGVPVLFARGRGEFVGKGVKLATTEIKKE